MFSGGQVPYDTDDSGMVDFQNSSDAFLDENSTLVGNIPMDSIDVSEPIYSVPVYKTKKKREKKVGKLNERLDKVKETSGLS